jgi:hypothetical protein
MSLEALSHAASAAFPLFERELKDIELKSEGKISNFPRPSPLRRASSLGTEIVTRDLQNQRDISSVLPSVPTLSRQHSQLMYAQSCAPPK